MEYKVGDKVYCYRNHVKSPGYRHPINGKCYTFEKYASSEFLKFEEDSWSFSPVDFCFKEMYDKRLFRLLVEEL